jgi:ribonuclease HI
LVNLYKLTQSLDIEWHWVKAHAGNTLNEEVDALAKDAG